MPTPKPDRKKPDRKKQARKNPAKPQQRMPSSFEQAAEALRQPRAQFQPVSVRWLLGAAATAVIAAVLCGWLTLCFLYWTGNWQLLYHPTTAITRTPATAGLPYEPVKFAATETGTTRLTGWWIPAISAPAARLTVLYLHGPDGNLSDTVDLTAALHYQHLNVFAIDYRGYGQSQPLHEAGHPNEKQLRQDAEWALTWLTLTRHVPAKNIVVCGTGLGAILATELAADHSELAGVILDQPPQDAMAPVFSDSRSRLVPTHWLIKDRYDLTAAASTIKTPSLWVASNIPEAYRAVTGQKTALALRGSILSDAAFGPELRRWLDDLR